ncbi:methionyl-tRNA synthetase, partial [Penicillium herquei]
YHTSLGNIYLRIARGLLLVFDIDCLPKLRRLILEAHYKWFNISFDTFGRATTPLQTEITQEIFLKLHQNGFLKEGMTTQLYCEQHQSFLADRFVQGSRGLCQLLDPLELKNPRCKIDGATPVTRETKHIFLELDKPQSEIAGWFQQSASSGAWSSNGKKLPLPG